jgi:nitroimidazol reductase NimA-like FMN-containing flavoprotein (pyridoxamine 5'-phosphate oxidase superfamily)
MQEATSTIDFPPTPRTRVKRLADCARYDRETVYAILDAGLVCHVGYEIDGQPYVTATAYWREGDRVYWHGSSASRMLRRLGDGVPVCFTVALLDGLVLARSGYNSTLNYRSVMAFGTAEPVIDEAEKLAALETFSERLTPGRWPELRPVTKQELKATLVFSLALEEVSAKVSSGPPVDDEADYAAEVWAGVLPVRRVIDPPAADPRLRPGIAAPAYLNAIEIDRHPRADAASDSPPASAEAGPERGPEMPEAKPTPPVDFPPTPRTRVKRLGYRACYDRDTVYGILDAGLVCHVGYVIDGQPYVTPTACWREGDRVYWHGSSASRMLRRLEEGVPVCVTVAHLDGLVLARSGFHSSINYRSVMAFGTAEAVTGEAAKLTALESFSERLAPGRWAEQRAPSKQELKATLVMSLKLEEVAAKVRAGPPADDEEDYALDVWAGVVPIRRVVDPPVDDPRLKAGIARPGYLDTVQFD